MISNRLGAWFRDRKAEIRQALTAARSEPGTASSPEWYAGLVVSPASFSRQLGDMQLSLLRANAPEPQQAQGRIQTGDPVGVSRQRS
jgi:hypothetical protein